MIDNIADGNRNTLSFDLAKSSDSSGMKCIWHIAVDLGIGEKIASDHVTLRLLIKDRQCGDSADGNGKKIVNLI